MTHTTTSRMSAYHLEASLVTGLLAVSLLVITVVAASRLKSVTRAFGIERVLLTHRSLGVLALAMILAHTAFVVADHPAYGWQLLSYLHAPPRARAATTATVCFVLLVGTALLRRRTRLDWELWRAGHVVLATAGLVLAGLHVLWLNHLIRNPAMRAWFVTASLVLIGLLAKRWVVGPLRTRAAYSVVAVRPESASVSTLVLRPRHRWQRGLRFTAGQFAWLRLPGRGWDEHPFTIASDALRPRQLEFTIRHVGDFTRAVGDLTPGTLVGVDGPHGSFTPDRHPVEHLLLVAAGVGVTPMMSILRTMARRGDQLPVTLLLAARNPADLLFREELARLQQRLTLWVVEIVSDPRAEWEGTRGRVDQQLLAGVLPSRRARTVVDVYICGPGPMVEGVLAAAQELGVPPDRVHTEQFDMV